MVDAVLEEGEVDESECQAKENGKLRCNVEACNGKAFKKPFPLLRNWADIHEEKITLYKCGGCTKVFRRKTVVKLHALQKHQS